VKISIVITTYNRPEALTLVLRGLAAQTDSRFEAIVADDGSTPETAAALERVKAALPYRLRHVWQPDEGFRAPMARNRASAIAEGEYIVFLDGDCVPLVDFVAGHRRLAAPGWLVSGNRVLLDRRLTERATGEQLPLWTWTAGRWLKARLAGEVNRLGPLLRLADWSEARSDLTGAKTCNLAVWRRDLLAVNGFDEEFIGWGYEDSDLVQRLLNSGCRRRSTRWAVPVLHLWHAAQDRGREKANLARLEQTVAGRARRAAHGIDQYLAPAGMADPA
jgi:glycosyltransferase involved in cell wall biosynthesis